MVTSMVSPRRCPSISENQGSFPREDWGEGTAGSGYFNRLISRSASSLLPFPPFTCLVKQLLTSGEAGL